MDGSGCMSRVSMHVGLGNPNHTISGPDPAWQAISGSDPQPPWRPHCRVSEPGPPACTSTRAPPCHGSGAARPLDEQILPHSTHGPPILHHPLLVVVVKDGTDCR